MKRGDSKKKKNFAGRVGTRRIKVGIGAVRRTVMGCRKDFRRGRGDRSLGKMGFVKGLHQTARQVKSLDRRKKKGAGRR